jgi:diacylglycerol kinase (ATP)
MSKSDNVGRAKLIVNPAAGNMLEATTRLEQVTRYLLEYGVNVDVALAKPTKEAIPIARKAVKNDYSIVITMGGDGTIGAVIRGLAGSKVHLGIIPVGTQNDIARSLGIPEDLKEACALIASDQTHDLDLGQVSTKAKKKFYFFMVTTIGLTSTIYPDIKDVPEGNFSGIKDAVMTFLQFKPNPKVFLTLNDESRIEVETMLVTVANTPVIGVKNLVAPDASMDDGLLDIAVYPGFSKAELLAYFAKTAQEGVTEDGKIQRYRARKVKIKTSPKLDVAAEGILLGKGKAKIKLLPRALRVIAPELGSGVEKPQAEAIEELLTPVSMSVDADDRANHNNQH